MNDDMRKVRVLAIDLAKHVFAVAGEDGRGVVRFETSLRSRAAFWEFVRTLEAPLEVLLETGPGAQAWARELQGRGLSVRILPAQRVAEHRSGAKNDRRDARALLRAGRDTEIHAVPIKSAELLAMQAVHRVRAGYGRRRTAISNQIRGLLLEQGLVVARGDAALRRALSRWLADATVPLPDRLRSLLAELEVEWNRLGERIEALTGELERMARSDEEARQLMTIRGIGPVTATALRCKEQAPQRFANGRRYAAYFGLVPEQHSTGGRTRLGRMCRRGDGYIRSLVLQGAHAVLQRVPAEATDPDDARLRRWLQRHGRKGAAVRLANRNLRIAWAVQVRATEYQRSEVAMN